MQLNNTAAQPGHDFTDASFFTPPPLSAYLLCLVGGATTLCGTQVPIICTIAVLFMMGASVVGTWTVSRYFIRVMRYRLSAVMASHGGHQGPNAGPYDRY